MRSRYKRIVMQSSSESSAEHALVDALRIVFLRHRGRSWAQIKAETGISKGTAQRQWLDCPKPLLQPRPQVLDLPHSAKAHSHCPKPPDCGQLPLSSARKLTGCVIPPRNTDKHGGEHEQSGS